MTWRATICLLLASVALGSCRCNETARIRNTATTTLVLVADGREYTIEPRQSRKVRGIHYSGAEVHQENGKKLSFDEAFRSILVDWSELRSTHICDGLNCATFSVDWSSSGEFHLLACDSAAESRILVADQDGRSQDDR